jgi:hypothetical protein
MRFVLGVTIVFMVLAADARAQCALRLDHQQTGSTTDTYYADVEAQTVFSTTGGDVGTSCTDADLEQQLWFEGRQPNGGTFCGGHQDTVAASQSANGVCAALGHGSIARVTHRYGHPTIMTGSWGSTARHIKWGYTQIDTHRSRWYSTTLASGGQCPNPYDYYWNGSECVYTPGSPIVLPLRANKGDTHADYRLTGISAGATFDLNADGAPDYSGWTAPGSALGFLVYDRNGNGIIDDASEMFGNHTHPSASNGFEALYYVMPQTDDGRLNAIDANDPLYAKLQLWEDRNSDRISQPEELLPFSAIYAAIGTGWSMSDREDAFGNKFLYQGWAEVRTGPGLNRAASATEHGNRLRAVFDVFFKMEQ